MAIKIHVKNSSRLDNELNSKKKGGNKVVE